MTEDILVSHSGKQHSYKLALALQELGRLSRFLTSAYYYPHRFPDKVLSRFEKIDSFLRKRYEPGLSDKVRRFPVFEVPEFVLRATFGNSKLVSDTICVRDALFDKFTARTQIRNCGIFWGFQGSCIESLKEARRKGIISVVELATAHVTEAIKILDEEKKMNPEWSDSINNLDFPAWYIERLKEEPFQADFCVAASSFTKKTLEKAGIDGRKILTLPLGVDSEKFTFRKREKKPFFQALFVGSIGQRKGVKYLLDAARKLNTAKLRLKVIGPIVGTGRAFRRYMDTCEYMGFLGRDEIIKHMQESDCLVLPSLFEGFGRVIPEAMSTGMPVVASTRTAAPDIIREGIDGFIIEPRDVDGLAAKLEWLMTNEKEASVMGQNAAQRIKGFSWGKHKERLKEILPVIKSKR